MARVNPSQKHPSTADRTHRPSPWRARPISKSQGFVPAYVGSEFRPKSEVHFMPKDKNHVRPATAHNRAKLNLSQTHQPGCQRTIHTAITECSPWVREDILAGLDRMSTRGAWNVSENRHRLCRSCGPSTRNDRTLTKFPFDAGIRE